MKTKLAIFALCTAWAALPLAAQVSGVECDRCWTGLCEAESILNPTSLERTSWSAACRIEIMPAEGFAIRWRILMIPFDKQPEEIWLPRIADFLTSQAVDDFELTGAIWYDLALWGRMRFVSIDPETRAELRELSDVPDTEPNYITIRPLEDAEGQPVRRVIEMLVEQPEGAVVNGIVSWEWLQDHWKSIQLLYGTGIE